ncbi:signal peptidase I [Lindgomyces ingoldianus]|uniref:Signal peptidase I n=1 Tax=Lindgomyces ingoldianus TaxID=673940 RepID=A0ACB6QT24_9PLEO|nr:signal peptidase I [Lindgomyces ingoldianus]KAF2469718.1 signal peptidase I [Lindgomyces ingoldianus]
MNSTPSVRRWLSELLQIAYAIATILMLWATLRVVTGSPHPILTVSSESMEPTFYRGDIILLWNRQHYIDVGDIPVVWFPGRSLPMVHRAIKVIHQDEGESDNSTARQLILTKGDNNDLDDTSLYPNGRAFVHREEIVGLVRAYIPYLGRLSLVVKDQPWILYASLAGMLAVGKLL